MSHASSFRTDELRIIGERARKASRALALSTAEVRNRVLQGVSRNLRTQQEPILAANRSDLEAARQQNLSEHLLDRLLLTGERLEELAADVERVAALEDPVGKIIDSRELPNGIRLSRIRVPIGVIGVIYESRPNVTIDIASLCLKSGNAAILRGGSEARNSNGALAAAVRQACREAGLSEESVQLVTTQEREVVREMLRSNRFIDLIIPRGGAGLHQFALENSTIPVVTGGIGICHAYVDAEADAEKAVPIVHNAKVQRPSVCNALDTLLIHHSRSRDLLPLIAAKLAESGVELRCDEAAFQMLRGQPAVKPAGPEDFDTEFLSLVLAVRVVRDLEEAIEHIATHSTGHSETIITENAAAATRFTREVDSAAVYVNASTRFTDGGQFGLGAEVAISTQRVHARGPMGLEELTTYKWVGWGDGQIRE